MIDRALLVRKAFAADNHNTQFTDTDYAEAVKFGGTEYLHPIVAAVLEQLALPEPEMTAEEIDVLPDRTVIANRYDDILQYRNGLWLSSDKRSCGSEWVAREYQPITILRLGKP